MKSILLVKTSAIGDVIQTFPVLEYLRSRFPAAQIDWMVEKGCADVVSAHPMISHIKIVHTKKWKKHPWGKEERGEFKKFRRSLDQEYDVVFDLQGNTKSGLLSFFAKAKEKVGFGWNTVTERPNLLFTTKRFESRPGLDIRTKYLDMVQQYFQDKTPFQAQGISLKISNKERDRLSGLMAKMELKGRFRLMVAFGSNWQNKMLKEEVLLACLKKIEEKISASFVFVYGNQTEKQVAERLHGAFASTSIVVGEMSLPFWQSLMGEMDGVFTVDSAALHLCGTTKTPSFSVFGPSLASIYKPTQEKHVAFQGACPYGKTFEKRCPILRTCSTGACLREVADQVLFESFMKWHASLKSPTAAQSRYELAPQQSPH